MDFEVIDVIREAIDMHRLHALAHSPHQTGTFITGKIEATALPQVLEQMLEFRVLFGWAHATSPFRTKVTRAEEISSNGRTKSALPVCMAAPGMPKNSALLSSWTITVPSIFLIALTPIEPSLPVPVKTTAMARSLKLAATDSNNRSAGGRRQSYEVVGTVREGLRGVEPVFCGFSHGHTCLAL